MLSCLSEKNTSLKYVYMHIYVYIYSSWGKELLKFVLDMVLCLCKLVYWEVLGSNKQTKSHGLVLPCMYLTTFTWETNLTLDQVWLKAWTEQRGFKLMTSRMQHREPYLSVWDLPFLLNSFWFNMHFPFFLNSANWDIPSKFCSVEKRFICAWWCNGKKPGVEACFQINLQDFPLFRQVK